MKPTETLAALRQQLDEAQETIRQLRRSVGGEFEKFYGVAGLTYTQAKFVSALVEHGRVERERMAAIVWDGSDPACPKTIDVTICYIRKKLRKHGITINTLWGHGYEMPQESRDKLRRLAGLQVVPSQEAA